MPRKDNLQDYKDDKVEETKTQVITENQLVNIKLDHIISMLESVIVPKEQTN